MGLATTPKNITLFINLLDLQNNIPLPGVTKQLYSLIPVSRSRVGGFRSSKLHHGNGKKEANQHRRPQPFNNDSFPFRDSPERLDL
ncbi:unnamed protein product [Cuscuta campestris]|uniref:Uncharacterized protein n=1 Tax=Cuscuta campestris TaxID=132261 RepID=A0A484LT29_9ASTE|nr:unnamed protein product [Cuscuta campestris]